MARRVRFLTLCDLCPQPDAPPEDGGDVQAVVVAFGGGPARELDLCSPHREPFAQTRELAERHGRVLRDTPSRKAPAGVHSQYRTPLGTYRCPQCEFESHTPQGLAAHTRTRHDDAAATPCPVCGRPCKGGQGLTMHMKKHEPGGSEPCPECGDTFATRGGLAGHLFRKHGIRGKLAGGAAAAEGDGNAAPLPVEAPAAVNA